MYAYTNKGVRFPLIVGCLTFQFRMLSRKRQREVDKLADAILKLYEWRHNQFLMRQERKIKAMTTRLRNVARQNRERRLPN